MAGLAERSLAKAKIFGNYMLKFIRDNTIGEIDKRRLARLRNKISVSVPEPLKAKVIILNLNSDPLNAAGKVVPNTFFPPFCAVLARCGIASVYLNDMENMSNELIESEGIPIVVISLVHELYDDLDRYKIPNQLIQKVAAVFNSHQTAGIIGDKRKANRYLSNQGVPMPSLNPDPRKKIFSNARVGSHEEVYLYDSVDDVDVSRYNTEFIDTRVEFNSTYFYTTIRLACIGSNIVQIYGRASDVENGNPSVHSTDTPRDCGLMDYIRDQLVIPHLEQFRFIAEKIEAALGPGFYVHDLLIDQENGNILLCETGFKFYDGTYSNHMMDTIGSRRLLTGIMDTKSYAAYAASMFVTYCVANSFI